MKPRPAVGITWTNLELSGLLEDEDSHVYEERITKHMSLQPYHLRDLNAAVRQCFDESINIYDSELKGLLLAYKDPKIITPNGCLMFDTHYIHIDVEVNFYVFRPEVGQSLRGFVNKKGTNHIGILVHKAFNVSVPMPDRLENWPDVEDVPEWPGHEVKVGQEVRFTLEVVDFKSRLPYLRGSINEDDYLKGCKLFSKEIAATFENEFQGFPSSNGDDQDDKKNVKIKTENKRMFFDTDSESEVDTKSKAKKSSKKEKIVTKPSKKRKRSSTSSEAESEVESQAQRSNDFNFEVPTTPSKKRKKDHVENGVEHKSNLLLNSEVDNADDADDADEVKLKKHKKKSKKEKIDSETDNEREHKAKIKKLINEPVESDEQSLRKSKKHKSKADECVDTEDEKNYKSTLKKDLSHLLVDESLILKKEKSKSRKRKMTESDDLCNTDDEKNYKKKLKKMIKLAENGDSDNE